uniref:Uncharacterized protein n=1 Tax=Equus caballus TaxID=9796 RepID=A0A9L0TPU0_HORSE
LLASPLGCDLERPSRILRFSVIKNIRIGVRLEQTGNKTRVAFNDCHTPPGNLSIEVLENPARDPLLYNDILSCLYTSKENLVDPQDSTAAALIQLLSLRELEPGPETSGQSRGSVGLTVSTPDPPTVRLDGHTAMAIQPGSLALRGPSNTSSVSVSWKLLSKTMFSSKNQELKLQFTPNSSTVALGPHPAGLAGQEERLEALVLELRKRTFLPHHNELLREQGLPLPSVKGISFDQARMEPSEDYMLLTVPEE